MWFCFDDVPKSLGPGEYHYWETKAHYGVRYAYEIEWVDGWWTETETQDPITPLDPGGDMGPQCLDLLYDAYHECQFFLLFFSCLFVFARMKSSC
jgi:hypothetical protein